MALTHPNPSTKPLKLHLNSLILLKILLATTAQDYPPIPASCQQPPQILHKFPGFGWDAIKAQPRNFVFKMSYTKCSNLYSHFGGFKPKFLLAPDQLQLSSLRKKWKNYENDVTSTEELAETPSLVRFVSENTNAYKSPLKALLSEDFKRWKKKFKKYDGVVHRRQLVIERFEAVLKEEIALSDNFTAMMNAVLRQQERDNENLLMIRLAELVEQFGTHYTTSAVYGGNAFIDRYGARGSIKVEFIGGNKTVSPATKKWVDSTADNATIVSLSGDFIFSLLRSRPEFSGYSADVRSGVHSKFFYYILNYCTDSVHSGCTKFAASNFNGRANKDDGSCVYQGRSKEASKALRYQNICTWIYETAKFVHEMSLRLRQSAQ